MYVIIIISYTNQPMCFIFFTDLNQIKNQDVCFRRF
jgi:hypothetical protein